MFHMVSSMDKDIVHRADDSIKALQDFGHGSLKYFRRGTNSKGQAIEAKAAKGVTKVVNNFESSSKGICQKLLLASNFVILCLNPACQALIHRSHEMSFALHCFVQWCQVYTDPYTPIRFGDRQGTMPEHHSVGTVTGEMTPCRSNDSISLLTLGNNGLGIFLGV